MYQGPGEEETEAENKLEAPLLFHIDRQVLRTDQRRGEEEKKTGYQVHGPKGI